MEWTTWLRSSHSTLVASRSISIEAYLVSARIRKGGPRERIGGMTFGIVTVTGDAPHNGEVHLYGDEIPYVISGKLRAIDESEPNTILDFGAA